jgi:hypothetical protein
LLNSQPVEVLIYEVVAILCGTLGLVQMCFGSIAILASIFTGGQINFLVQENPRTAMVAGTMALWRFS